MAKKQSKNKAKNAAKALYAFTLQPISCNLTEDETRQAQLEMFDATNTIEQRTSFILAAAGMIGVAGLFYFKGYQSIFFWLLLAGVAGYFFVKFVAIKFYVKYEMKKQPIPPEMREMKLGLQPHGLVMAMPQEYAMKQMQNNVPKANKSMMTMMNRSSGRDIPWHAMSDWKETKNYYVVSFEMEGQPGTQIIPKRMKDTNFPLDNMVKLLKENVEQK